MPSRALDAVIFSDEEVLPVVVVDILYKDAESLVLVWARNFHVNLGNVESFVVVLTGLTGIGVFSKWLLVAVQELNLESVFNDHRSL